MRYFLFLLMPFCSFSQDAESVYSTAKESYYKFQYRSAIEHFQIAKTAFRKSGDLERMLKCYYFISMAHFELDQTGEALEELYQGSGISIEKFGEGSRQSGDFYIAYGKLYHLKESYDTAKLFYRYAAELKNGESTSLDFGELYTHLALAHDHYNQFDSAVIFYEKAANILETHLGLYHPYTEWVYASIPFVADKLGNHQKELDAAVKSLEINKKLWGEESDYVADSYRVCGTAYQHLGKYVEEKDCAHKALDIKIKVYGAGSDEAATGFYELGNAYARMNQFEMALEFGEKAYQLKKDIYGEKAPETLAVFRNLGNIHYDAGAYEKALNYYAKHLEWQQKLNKKNSPQLIQPMKDLAQTYERLGKYDEAKELYYRIISLQEATEEDKWMLVDSHISIARILDEQSDPAGAIRHLELALQYNRKHNQGNRSEQAFIYNNMGTVFSGTNDYVKAENYLTDALKIRTALLGQNAPEVAQTMANLVSVQMALERYDEAKAAYQKCLEIYEDHFGSNHLAVGRLLVNMATLSEKQGDLRGEIELLQRAKAINEQFAGEISPELYTVYFNLSIAYANLTQFEKAFESLEKATVIAKDLYGERSIQMADLYNQQGLLKQSTGRSLESFAIREKAIGLYKSVLGERHTKLADAYNNAGVAYMELDEYMQAKRYLEEAVRIYSEVLGSASREVVSTKMNLGLIESGRGRYSRAIEIYSECLQLGLKSFGEQHPFIASVYQNLGVAYSLSDRKREALESYDKCLQVRKSIFRDESIDGAHIHNNLSSIFLDEGNLKAATEHITLALAIYRKEIGNRSGLTARSLNILADISTADGSYSRAIALADDAIDANMNGSGEPFDRIQYFISQVKKVDNSFLLYHQTTDSKYLYKATDYLADANQALAAAEKEIFSEEDQLQFSRWKTLLTNIGVKNSLALFRLTDERRHLEEALYYAERSKANVLLAALNKMNARKLNGIDHQLLQREHELKVALQKANEELFKLEHKSDQHEQRVNALSRQVFAWRRELEQVEKELLSSPKYRELAASDMIISLDEVQNKLITGEHEAIVEYAASDSTLHIFLITKKEVRVFSRRYEEKFDNLVLALRNAIFYKADPAFNFASSQLYDLTMADVEAYLHEEKLDIRTLTIVPEGPFNYIPFEALKRDNRYLIEIYDIRYSYSLSLSELLQKREISDLENSYLAFAPVFADAGTNLVTPEARDVFMASREVASQDMRGFSVNGEYISPLPGTELEVSAIDQLMVSKGHGSQLFLKADAKEDVIKMGNMADHKYIHFATHGFVNEAHPAFSGIFMSQNRESKEDCILFVSEIYNLRLNAELVTLSACETALGRFASGEGIVGLTRAFIYAGAKNLLVSQWKVSDESTARMMVDFYDGLLAGSDKAAALREAKLNLLASESFSKPYYWAPFVLIGK